MTRLDILIAVNTRIQSDLYCPFVYDSEVECFCSKKEFSSIAAKFLPWLLLKVVCRLKMSTDRLVHVL
jgi:hypothetical protein